jgi:hypothetical protein
MARPASVTITTWLGNAAVSGFTNSIGSFTKGMIMRKLLLSVALVALSAVGANAASNVSFGGGFNLGHVQTQVGTVTAGTAAAGSLATGTNTSLGAGIATTTPAGSLTSAVGASAGQSNSLSGAFSIGNGAAATGGLSNNIGVGLGVGFTNTTP